jgi:ELWxxDGT repeat protein
VLDVFPGPQSGTPITRTFPGYFSLAELNGRVLFGADDGVHGVELWSSDGTADGTKMVVDALSEPGNSSLLLALTRVSDRVLFSSGGETYVTDGTAQGTVSIVSGRVIIPTQRDQRVTLGDSLIFNYQEAVYRLTPRDVVAPAIRSGHYRFNFPQPFVDVFFSEPVRGAAAFDQIRVRNVDTGTDVTDPAISLLTGLVTLQSQLDIRFPGAPRGVLPDGNYRLIIPAGALADGFRNVNHQLTFDFFVLAGDINRNRVVDNLDAGVMAHHFNTAGGFQKGDFDYSGFIDMTDFSILAQRFNLPLAPPPPARLGSSSFPFSENRLVDAVAALD